MRLLVAVLSLAGCIRSNLIKCGDLACSAGSTCVGPSDALHCASPDDLAACAGTIDGDTCTVGGETGLCVDGACEPSICGDGRRTGTEPCDGSDLGGADCTTAGFYEPGGLTCSRFCTFDTSQCVGRCGNGVIDGPELCDGAPPAGTCVDDGFDAGPLDCSNSCGESFTQCARFGWTPEPIALASANAISGTSPSDVWAVGGVGQTLHFDGVAWTPFASSLPTALILGVWATSPSDAWLAGDTGVAHWDGVQWTAVTGVPAASYSDVWAANSDAVFVATHDVGVLSWNGATWQALGTYAGGAMITIRGTSASDIWVTDASTLWHWDGAAWTPALGATISSISAVAPDDVWVVGSIGASFDSVIAHWDGASWTQWTSTVAGLYSAVTASAPNDAWVASNSGVMFHFDGTAWTQTTAVAPPGRQGPAVFVNFGPGSILALSFDGVTYRYRGQAYVAFDPPIGTTGFAAWLDSGDDVFIADTQGHLLHYDGSAWTGTSTVVDTEIISVFGTGPDNVWAASTSGRVYRFDPATSTWPLSTTFASMGVGTLWGTGPSDMWVGGGMGTFHYDGVSWQPRSTAQIIRMSGTASNDLWGVTEQGALLHWDGASLQPDTTGAPASLVDIVAIAPDHVVAIDTSYAYTWDGAAWTPQLLPITEVAMTIVGTAADNLVVASETEIAQFDGTRWSPLRLPPEIASPSTTIAQIVTTPNLIAMLLNDIAHPVVLRAVLRTQPWVCEVKETDCTNGVDDDCDGKIDALDPDCQ